MESNLRRHGCGGLGKSSAVRALQRRAIDGVADRVSAPDGRLYHFRLASSRQASTTRWTAAAPPSRCVRSRRDTDLYRADVVKLEIIGCGQCAAHARSELARRRRRTGRVDLSALKRFLSCEPALGAPGGGNGRCRAAYCNIVSAVAPFPFPTTSGDSR